MRERQRSQTKIVLILTILTTLSLRVWAESPSPNDRMTRYAIVVGANDGGSSRSRLKYADKDAREIAAVLHSFGGVDASDLVLLVDPGRFSMESAFANMRKRLENTKQSGMRQEVLLYYSGHSDDQGLLLGDDDFPYRELKDAIAMLPADVRIAILDSCSSGALSRLKGGARRAPFLVDSSVNVEGHAYMTSASADEAAQESDKIGGSFFTHYLTTGLRGAADADGNRKVTLNEAYNYAFQETLSRTESTWAGPQHANYDFRLKGSGDLVLTDLRGTSALLTVSSEVTGRVYIRDDKGELIAEVNKLSDDAIHLGLDPGRYTVTVENEKGLFRGTVQVGSGHKALLRASDLNEETREITIARGTTAQPLPRKTAQTTAAGTEKIVRPVQFGLFPGGISLLPLKRPEGPKQTYFAVNFIGDGHYLTGMEAGMLGSIRYYNVKGLQASGLFNVNTAETRGLQAAGLFNFSKGMMYGLQTSGLFNFTGEGRGLKAAGLFNYTAGPGQGLHAAGLFNFVDGPTRGFTAGGLFNVNTSSSHGFLGAGLLNLNRAASMGYMGAGLVNINGGAYHGFQGAGLVNVSAKDESNGVQAAGLVNFGARVKGFQGAGLVNIARESMTGLQAGLINIGGDVKGAQLGLVNIATGELKGAQVGLVNVGGGLYLAPTLWATGSSYVNMGFKLGGRLTYAILGFGVHPHKGESRSSIIYGFGCHLSFEKLWLDIDVVDHILMADYGWTRNSQDDIYKLRPTVGYRILDQLSVYAGPSLNLLVSELREDAELIPGFWSHTSDDINLRMSIDFVVGIQWEPKFGKLNGIAPLGGHASR